MRRATVSGTTALFCLALWACDSRAPQHAGEFTIDPGAMERGRALFFEHCALCHGERGDGQGPRRGSLSRRPANFRSPLFDTDPERVRRAIRDGIVGSDMPGWQRLGDRAVDDLTSYVLAVARSSQ
jgi:mono/diheme cytochrome c family protein